MTLFFLASAGCAVAWDTTSIIGFRALQGAGAALMMPVSATIVLAVFPEGERGRVMAIYAGISQVFLALGPLVGGLLTEYVTWRAVFLLNVPVGLATLALVAVAKIENRPVAGARIAVRDAALVVPGLALVTLGVQQLASWGPISLVLLAAGVGLVAWFVARQLRSADPLIHLRLFADRGFTGDAVVMGLVQFGLLGIVLYSSIYLQELLGFGPMAAGLAALPLILPLTVAAQIGGRWFDRAGVRAPVLAGLALCTVGIVAWLVALPALSYAWQIPGMLLVGVGLGLTLSPTNTDALGRVPDAERSPGLGRGPDRAAGRWHPGRRRDRRGGARAGPRPAGPHRHRRVHRRGLRRRRGLLRPRHPRGRRPARPHAFGQSGDPLIGIPADGWST